MAGRQQRVLKDHEEIREWAESRRASPSCVRGTGSSGDVGMLRLDFPGYSGETSLEHIEWDEWFDKFDERGLALLVEDTTARGQKSNFNKLVSRETAEEAESGMRSRSSARQGGGTHRKTAAKRSAASRARKSTGTKHAARSKTASASKNRTTIKRAGSKTAGRKTAGRKATARKSARGTRSR